MFVSKTLRSLTQASRIYTRSKNISMAYRSSLLASKTSGFKYYSTDNGASKSEKVTIHFKLPDGQVRIAKAKVGSSLLDVVIDNNVGLDGFGACEGTLACSTCHLVFSPEVYKKLPNKPMDEELDMLDLAYGLTDTSRLGCQIIVTKDMDGLEVAVPEGLADARS